ncbi:MAG: molybdopterin-dependent oxidoreductase [Steroidobacteraceae bacterium]
MEPVNQIASTICRVCLAFCPVMVELENKRAVRVFADKNNPVYFGYTCVKGRHLTDIQYHPQRLLTCQKKQPDGTHAAIASSDAVREVAAKLQQIIAESGPRAVATYGATGTLQASATVPVLDAFMDAIGSPMRFTSNTIDQPGKAIAAALHGGWAAGYTTIEQADCWLMVGMNPPISKVAASNNPARVIHHALKRGMKLVVIDPRNTETARKASVHLQPKPGEDPAVLAGMLRVIFSEKLHDAEFLRENAIGLEALQQAVEPYTVQYVAQRAAVDASDLIAAARVFASGQRGGAAAGTGPNMATHGNLTEYLLRCLMTVCGYWPRVGDRIDNPSVMVPQLAGRAEPTPPMPAWGFGEKLRVRNLTNAACGMPVTALPDEILMPGDGQVRALICVGGNPLVAWPDQEKTARALEHIELLIVLDLRMTATAKLAHYVIAPRYGLEVPAVTAPLEFLGKFYAVGAGITKPWAQYCRALIDPPAGADVLEDWEFFYLLAREMGLQLEVGAGFMSLDPSAPKARLDMQHKPTSDEILEIIYRDGRVPLATVKSYPDGHLFDADVFFVQPRSPECTAMLQLGDPTMIADFASVLSEGSAASVEYPLRLISRRMLHVYNSAGREMPELAKGRAYNPVFMHPNDLDALGFRPRQVVQIRSRHGAIEGILEADDTMKPGVVSMSHAFGVSPRETADVHTQGGNVGRLTPTDEEYDLYTGIPRMSGIPVSILPIGSGPSRPGSL